MNIKLKLAAVALACAVSGTTLAAEPIKIGMSGPFTGGS